MIKTVNIGLFIDSIYFLIWANLDRNIKMQFDGDVI